MNTLIVENLSSVPQQAWAVFGLPDALEAQFEVESTDGTKCPVLLRGQQGYVRAKFSALERAELRPIAKPFTMPAFQFSPWVVDQPNRLLPTFFLVEGGFRHRSEPMVLNGFGPGSFSIEDACDARILWTFRTQIVAADMFVEGWVSIFSGQEVVEFVIRASYGSTAPGQPRERVFGSLSMIVGEKPVIDHRMPKGLHAPMWRMDVVPGQVWWEAELATPRAWLRTRTVRVKGALLCLPPEDRFGQLAGDSRLMNLQAREEAGIFAIADVWQGKFLSFGKVPLLDGGLALTLERQRRSAWLRREGTMGDEYAARPYGQPPNSGQTGEQPDFGAARCEHALQMLAPWALHDLDYSVDAWPLRPYANRYPSGMPVEARNHPGARLWNLRPDERFGSDHLGWPKPVGWIGAWDTSDSQHRSDNLLLGLFALTRDPSLRRTITDIIELQKMELDQGLPPLGSGVGSPRAVGRTLLSLCHMFVLGFTEVEPMIRKLVSYAFHAASFRLLPSEAEVRVLSSNEAKYGWVNPDGSPIRAWLPWQESIAVMGFNAAWLALQLAEARDLVLIPATTIVRHGFFRENGRWFACYGVRWRTDALGVPLSPTSYTTHLPNYDVFVFGIHRWILPALRILHSVQPNTPDGVRAKTILDSYGAPQNWDDGCWWAV